jgi:hypothetical protein
MLGAGIVASRRALNIYGDLARRRSLFIGCLTFKDSRFLLRLNSIFEDRPSCDYSTSTTMSIAREGKGFSLLELIHSSNYNAGAWEVASPGLQGEPGVDAVAVEECLIGLKFHGGTWILCRWSLPDSSDH